MKNLQKIFCLVVVLCAAQADAMTSGYNSIDQQAEYNKNLPPHEQLKNWVTLWRTESRSCILNGALLSNIESFFCKHPLLSFVDAGITTEQTLKEYDSSLLQYACMLNFPLIAQKLLELDVHFLGSHQHYYDVLPPLEWATYHRHIRISQMLITAGIHEAHSDYSRQPLWHAVDRNNHHDVRLLLLKRTQRKNYKPLTIIEGYLNTNAINLHTCIMENAQKKCDPTTLQLLDCATTQPHKLAKLGYPVELLPAQLPHILMMRERGVRYSGDRVGRIQRQMGRMEMQELQELEKCT